MPTVLALETSCDESAAAVVRLAGGEMTRVHDCPRLKNARWGWFEIASRRHVRLFPVSLTKL